MRFATAHIIDKFPIQLTVGFLQALPNWYTPSRLLGLFCWVTFLVYLDRGLLASNGVNDGISVRHMFRKEYVAPCSRRIFRVHMFVHKLSTVKLSKRPIASLCMLLD